MLRLIWCTFIVSLSSYSLQAINFVNYIGHTNPSVGTIVLTLTADTNIGESVVAQIRYGDPGSYSYSGFVKGDFESYDSGSGTSTFTVNISYPTDVSMVDIEVAACYDDPACNSLGLYSGFIYSASGLLLPVEISKFIAEKYNKNSILVRWQTLLEVNNAYFELERSSDGNNFEKIGRIMGNGSSSNHIDYTFNDRKPLSGNNYYRLKQVDYDGRFEYSEIILAYWDRKNLVIFPNPAFDKIYLDKDLLSQSYEIWTINGLKVLAGQIESEAIDIYGLTPGIYILSLGQQKIRFVKK